MQELRNAVVGLSTILLSPSTNADEFEHAAGEGMRATGGYMVNGAANGVSELNRLATGNGTRSYTWAIWWSGDPSDPSDPGPDIDDVAARYCAACERMGKAVMPYGTLQPLGIFAQLPLATERA